MKMPEEIEPFMFAPCGMNCKVCYKHLAHKNSCGGCLKIGSEKPNTAVYARSRTAQRIRA